MWVTDGHPPHPQTSRCLEHNERTASHLYTKDMGDEHASRSLHTKSVRHTMCYVCVVGFVRSCSGSIFYFHNAIKSTYLS